MRSFLIFVLSIITLQSSATKSQDYYLKFSTSKGDVYARLYNETPKHRDNFLKIVKDGTLNETLFHRVIKDFMIQGGDINSKDAKTGELLGEGDLGYTVDAEFVNGLIHKKGALAAARTNNSEKASSSSQFYIVIGKVFTQRELEIFEFQSGKVLTPYQKETYTKVGGTPHLDNSYTVFGEIVKELNVIDSISNLQVDRNARPLEDVKMQVSILKKKEVKKLLKSIKIKKEDIKS